MLVILYLFDNMHALLIVIESACVHKIISVFIGIPNGNNDGAFIKPGGNNNNSSISSKIETPNVKKRHRRAKSGGLKNIDPSQQDGE